MNVQVMLATRLTVVLPAANRRAESSVVVSCLFFVSLSHRCSPGVRSWSKTARIEHLRSVGTHRFLVIIVG